MNALELADELEKCIKDESTDLVCVDEAATMLRQQQAEINSLRNNGYKTHYELLRIEFLNQQLEIEKLKNLLLDNQILLDKTLNAWAKEMERKK
jgi:hypothetical protein